MNFEVQMDVGNQAGQRDVNLQIVVADDLSWATLINQRRFADPRIIKVSAGSDKCSIYRVPEWIRQHGDKAYSPQIISIGPFHRGEEGLKAMEEHKWRYLNDILKRKGDGFLYQLLEVTKNLEKRARASYSEEIELDSQPFQEMLLLDGCFVIELFLRKDEKISWDDDPIFKLRGPSQIIALDMLLLENQIPFPVLEGLFPLIYDSEASLREMALDFFEILSQLPGQRNIDNLNDDVLHLLDLLRSSFIPKHIKEKRYGTEGLKMIQSASQLQEAGLKFIPGENKTFLDIEYKNGAIEIPYVTIEDSTSPLFLNMMAFEQCYQSYFPYIAVYTTFMDCLINTDKDVEILIENKIINNFTGSNKGVATFFNHIGRNIRINDGEFYLHDEIVKINQHCQRHWPRWRANLMKNYFNSPWAIISVIAAIILILLTLTQTLFGSFPQFANG